MFVLLRTSRGTGILSQNVFFERRLQGGVSNAPSPAVSVSHIDVKRTDAKRGKREVSKNCMSRRKSGDFGCILMSAALGTFVKIGILTKR